MFSEEPHSDLEGSKDHSSLLICTCRQIGGQGWGLGNHLLDVGCSWEHHHHTTGLCRQVWGPQHWMYYDFCFWVKNRKSPISTLCFHNLYIPWTFKNYCSDIKSIKNNSYLEFFLTHALWLLKETNVPNFTCCDHFDFVSVSLMTIFIDLWK